MPIRLKSPAPCPRCGYPYQDVEGCTVCGWHTGKADSPLPANSPLPGAPARGMAALWAGTWAFPRGLLLLLGTRRIKRLMLPPFAITVLLFIGLIYSAERGLSAWIDRSLPSNEGAQMSLESFTPGWWRNFLEWILNEGFGLELLRGGSWVLFAALAILFSWMTFSLVFELVAGPFLDEIHGLLETRWFGLDPRKRRRRPVELQSETCTQIAWQLGGTGAILSSIAALMLSGPLVLFAFPLFFLPLALAALPKGLPGLPHGREFSRWLRWVLADNARSLSASAAIAILTLGLVVIALPLNLIPIVGSLLFGGVIGMGTAIGMLDLPLGRRDLTVHQRLSFASHHIGPIILFGAVTGVVFAVPIIGPMVAIPSASLGALWLVCRLDKSTLAPNPTEKAARRGKGKQERF